MRISLPPLSQKLWMSDDRVAVTLLEVCIKLAVDQKEAYAHIPREHTAQLAASRISASS